jgi:hypothetical protein
LAQKKKNNTIKTKAKTSARSKKNAKAKKGDKFVCQECGFSLYIDEPCGCDSEYSLLCCDVPMSWEGC